jgi:CheY-like chemotaxis protein
MVRLSFSVSDTGVGIAAENLESIFSPFKQVRTEGSNYFSGTGLGLAISSRLIMLMGGKIDVESTPGVGTTFSFSLDVPVVSEQEIQKQRTPPKGIIWQRRPQILLVEDNLVNQEVAIAYLKQLGCDVATANDGLEALDLVQQKTFDLIFMDCQMPRMDGYETTRRIRSLEGTGAKNVIIALTAHITNRDREQCFEAGMNDYMGKPYKIETLQHFLIKWLKSPLIAEDMQVSYEGADTPEEVGESEEKPENRKKIHDLRNALGGVIGGVELAMLSKGDPDNCERHLKTALKGAQQAVSISAELS